MAKYQVTVRDAMPFLIRRVARSVGRAFVVIVVAGGLASLSGGRSVGITPVGLTTFGVGIGLAAGLLSEAYLDYQRTKQLYGADAETMELSVAPEHIAFATDARHTTVRRTPKGFVASISGGRTFDPRTGTEWERTGIAPDSAVSDEAALTAAHGMTLERLASAADSTRRSALLWTRTPVLPARAKPVQVPADKLREYVGEYELRRVVFDGGMLSYQRDSARVREELTPVDDGIFALGEASRVEFIRAGRRVTAMTIVSPAGLASTFPRTQRLR